MATGRGARPRAGGPHGNDRWDALLGVHPGTCILLEEVALPQEVASFHDFGLEKTDEAARFLCALGAQGLDSPVARLRLYFKKDGRGSQEHLQIPGQVRATLQWIVGQGIAVTNPELVPLYLSAHHPPGEPLPPLPCYRAHSDALYLTGALDTAYCMSKQDTERLLQNGVSFGAVAAACNGNGHGEVVVAQDCTAPLQSRIEQNLKRLQFMWGRVDVDKLRNNSEEWANPSYEQWRSAAKPKIMVYDGAMPKRHLVFGHSILDFREGDLYYHPSEKTFFLNARASEDFLIGKLIEDYPNDADWASLKEMFATDADQFRQLIAKARANPETKKALDKILDDVQATEERAEKAALVNNPDARYTMQWFLNLLDLVKAQEKKTGLPDITFNKIARSEEGPDVYELSDTEGRIPMAIEDMERVNARIEYQLPNGEMTSHQTQLQASYRYRRLKVIFLKSLPVGVDDKTIHTVTLSFDRTVNLIDRLRAGFKRLNLPDDANLKATLSHNISFLFGPPGTGKTTQLAERIIDRMEQAAAGPVIVLTPTNKAADVLVRKIAELNGDAAPSWLIRTGNCTDAEVLRMNIVQNEGLVVDAQKPLVLVTTIHRFAYQLVAESAASADDTYLCDCAWSQVIFDEASMIPLAYITHAIHARQRQQPDTKFLVAGDPLQIPPVFDLASGDLEEVEELQMQNIYTMIELNSFDEETQKQIPVYGELQKIENLKTQHRSISPIGTVFSRYQYGGKILHSRGTPEGRRTDEPKALPAFFRDRLGFRPITIVRYKVQPGETIYNPRKLNKSPMHLYLSLLVSELVRRLRDEVDKEAKETWSLGLVAPYRAQADVMGGMIDAHTRQSARLRISTDTVHGFQGDQNDIIFAVLNPTSHRADNSRFLKKPFIINVAISRPEDYLILFVPDDQTDGMGQLPELTKLLSIVRDLGCEHWCELSATDLERKLTDKKNYFENHTFTTAHQSVNVYNKPPHPYFIRLCETAVDVHWEKE